VSVDFQPLRRDDFPMLGAWLAEPLVARWWHHETTQQAVERDFGPAVDGEEPTDMFLAAVGGRPFGLIQRYRVEDYEEDMRELASVWPVPREALSIDYLIGVSELRGRGLGAAMIAAFADSSWRAYPRAQDIVVPVAAGNRASWRALERAGFERVAQGELTPDNPRDPRDHYVYRLRRPSPAGSSPVRPAAWDALDG
jgi:aminoglycoside 6'-N-acetyltransferase